MKSRKKRYPAMQFLIFSFIGVLLFSIVVFSVLGIYMSRKSEKAISEIGEIYMSGMNQQMSGHFDTVIGLRFDQVKGIISVVPTDNTNREQLYEELIYRAKVRGFDYLALCSEEGALKLFMENPYSPAIQVLLWKRWYRGNKELPWGLIRLGKKWYCLVLMRPILCGMEVSAPVW